MTAVRPAAITADRSRRVVTIEWQDGHSSDYPFDGLRAVCPCVACKGGHAHMGLPPDPRLVRDAQPSDLGLASLSAVGAYALQPVWSDGHNSGIYTWDVLRAACPCAICLPE